MAIPAAALDYSFDDFELEENLLRGIYSNGVSRPTSFQRQAIPPMLAGQDIVGYVRSGCGTTTAYLISALAQIHPQEHHCQVLVLAAHRDLTMSIMKEVERYGQFREVRALALRACNQTEELQRLQAGQHVVLGTPGRVKELVRKNFLRVAGLKMLILDEADCIVERGFLSSVTDLFESIPEVQVCLFSYCRLPDVSQLVRRCMCNPVHVEVQPECTLEGVQHLCFSSKKDANKVDTLIDLLKALPWPELQVIIYCNTRRRVDWLSARMASVDWDLSTHDYMQSPAERQMALERFGAGGRQILICAEFVAEVRELRVPVVVNYDVPHQADDYLKRVGRRVQQIPVGKEIAVTIAVEEEMHKLKAIEADLGIQFEQSPMRIFHNII